jgi:hypothetical protein
VDGGVKPRADAGPRGVDLKRSVFDPASDQGMHLQLSSGMIAARDGLCRYKDPGRRLLSSAHKDTRSKPELPCDALEQLASLQWVWCLSNRRVRAGSRW